MGAARVLPLLKAHGSSNDVVILDAQLLDQALEIPAMGPGVAEMVRQLCARPGPIGADGVYLVDQRRTPPSAQYFNSDGTSAEICANGLRCVGRWLLERTGTDVVRVDLGGGRGADVFWAPQEGEVVSTEVVLPSPSWWRPGLGASEALRGSSRLSHEAWVTLPGSSRPLLALAAPNPHLVAEVTAEEFDETELCGLGATAGRGGVLDEGANVSFMVPVGPREWFVRTFERGVGLTPSCGSASVACRVALTMVHGVSPSLPVTLRSVGGPAIAWLEEASAGFRPHLSGNATFVYTTDVDLGALSDSGVGQLTLIASTDEIAAYAAVYASNLSVIQRAGVRVST